MPQINKHGVTLIELSIVLVIIGLIVGSVLVGQDLIHAAKLRAVISESENYKTAVNAFKSKYNCIAGDCVNATDFFGLNAACPNGDGTPHAGTCNGNGNGIVDATIDITQVFEVVRFWQQLGLAGLISGNYSGDFSQTIFTDGAGTSIGPNVPASKLYGGLWWASNYPIFGGSQLNKLCLGSLTGEAWGPVISGTDAYVIDSKIDDGKPGTGAMLAINGYDLQSMGYFPSGCVSGNDYDTSQPNQRCTLAFLLGI